MIQYNSRVEVNNGIKFYEQDLLYDDYLYSGNIDIDLTLDYANPGFGVALIDNEGNSIIKDTSLIFKLCSGTFEIIEKDMYNNMKTLFSTSASQARCYTKNLKFKISKRDNTYSFQIGDLQIKNIVLPCEINNYIIGYYSNKDNIIKSINIASSIPYGWIVNMSNTQGGYINFFRDGFELIDCKKSAEIEQLNITLEPGTYYLKYNKDKTDISSYVILSNDDRINDEEKNILNHNNFFTIKERSNISLKFVGTYGSIKNICITSESDNDYIRTNIETGSSRSINGSYIKFLLNNIKKFEFDGIINNAPGSNHYSPDNYSIIKIEEKSYGLYDLKISETVKYKYVYENGTLHVYDSNNVNRWSISTKLNESITAFKNINGYITNLKIIDLNDNETFFGVHNEITKYVPGLIKSPIIVLDKNRDDESAKPLDLSSSYRIIDKANGPYYYFTNIEREYFIPNRRIVLDKEVSIEKDSIKIYMIDKDAKINIDNILHIPDKGDDVIADTIDKFCDGQYLKITEEEFKEFGIVTYKDTGEIIFTNDLSEYQMIIVDYLKAESYAINYDYKRKSYAIDISTINKNVSIIYDNIETQIGDYEYINEQQYVDSGIIPSENCYIVIGR